MVNVSDRHGNDLPPFQIWRPSSTTPNFYKRIAEVQFFIGNVIENTTFYFAYGKPNHLIEIKPGDVIGYYQPSNPRHLLWSIGEGEYVSYSINASTSTNSIITSNTEVTDNKTQPFVRVYVGKCDFTVNPHKDNNYSLTWSDHFCVGS